MYLELLVLILTVLFGFIAMAMALKACQYALDGYMLMLTLSFIVLVMAPLAYVVDVRGDTFVALAISVLVMVPNLVKAWRVPAERLHEQK